MRPARTEFCHLFANYRKSTRPCRPAKSPRHVTQVVGRRPVACRKSPTAQTPRTDSKQTRTWNCETHQEVGISATIRTGAPVPPSIFIGSAASRNPVGGNPDKSATFSRFGTPAAAPIWWAMKSVDWPLSMLAVSMPSSPARRSSPSRRVAASPMPGQKCRLPVSPGVSSLVGDEVRGLAVVDAGGVDAEQPRAALFAEQARRCLADAREVQVAGLAGRVVAEVGERIGPAGGRAGSDEHCRSGRHPAVFLLPGRYVLDCHQVVGIGRGGFADVDHDARQDEPIQRDRRRVVAAVREVVGSIEVRAAVLGCRELLGGVAQATANDLRTRTPAGCVDLLKLRHAA